MRRLARPANSIACHPRDTPRVERLRLRGASNASDSRERGGAPRALSKVRVLPGALYLTGGLLPAGPPNTLSRAPLRRRAPFAWLTRSARSLGVHRPGSQTPRDRGARRGVERLRGASNASDARERGGPRALSKVRILPGAPIFRIIQQIDRAGFPPRPSPSFGLRQFPRGRPMQRNAVISSFTPSMAGTSRNLARTDRDV